MLLIGLKRLEYRGYDFASIAILNENSLNVLKRSGKVESLKSLVNDSHLKGTVGIAHTRWVTHGEPSDVNSHPYLDNTEKIVLVHNGIIENYLELKQILTNEDIECKRETDSEVRFFDHNSLPILRMCSTPRRFISSIFRSGIDSVPG